MNFMVISGKCCGNVDYQTIIRGCVVQTCNVWYNYYILLLNSFAPCYAGTAKKYILHFLLKEVWEYAAKYFKVE